MSQLVGVMEHVEVNGRRLAYRREGSGPALLLLHGGVCDSRVWRVQLEELSDAFTVVAWDAPGCGGSFDPPESFRLADYADCLAQFIGVLGLERPHVMGHSWGSGLALELCRRHPSLTRSLILAGAYAGWAGSLPPEEVEQRLASALALADQLPHAFDPRQVPGLFSDVMPPERAEELIGIMSEIRSVGTRVMARAFAEADLRDALPAVGVPTLLLHGAGDERSSLNVARAIHRAIPGSQLVVMPGLGHEAFVESSKTFNRHLRSFLSSLD